MGKGKSGRGGHIPTRGRPEGRARGASDGEVDQIDSEELTDLQRLALAVQDNGPPRTRSEPPPGREGATYAQVVQGAVLDAAASNGQSTSTYVPPHPPTPPLPHQVLARDSTNSQGQAPVVDPDATTEYDGSPNRDGTLAGTQPVPPVPPVPPVQPPVTPSLYDLHQREIRERALEHNFNFASTYAATAPRMQISPPWSMQPICL